MSIEVVVDKTGDIARWVCAGLNDEFGWYEQNLTFGFVQDGKLIGGLIFHDLRPHCDVWWTIYCNNRHWCNRKILRQMFAMVFQNMDCRRISLLVSKSNSQSLNFVQRLGFKIEGVLRKFRENGDDCYILGMLREECNWLKEKRSDINE